HRPERRFRCFEPPQTQARWKPRFGAHWIVWTDGSLWPRHVQAGAARSWTPAVDRPADEAEKRRVAAEAAPVYSHLHDGNSNSVGIELAHSGRATPEGQQVQLDRVEGLAAHEGVGRVGGQKQPPVLGKSIDLERARLGVDEPRVTHRRPSVDGQL